MLSLSLTASKSHYHSPLSIHRSRAPLGRILGIVGPVAAFVAIVYAVAVVLATGGILRAWWASVAIAPIASWAFFERFVRMPVCSRSDQEGPLGLRITFRYANLNLSKIRKR